MIIFLNKSVIFLLLDVDPLILALRFHWYPPPGSIDRLSYNGKCMLYQQLRRDLTHGRLYCSSGEAAALGALIVQGKFIELIHQILNEINVWFPNSLSNEISIDVLLITSNSSSNKTMS